MLNLNNFSITRSILELRWYLEWPKYFWPKNRVFLIWPNLNLPNINWPNFNSTNGRGASGPSLRSTWPPANSHIRLTSPPKNLLNFFDFNRLFLPYKLLVHIFYSLMNILVIFISVFWFLATELKPDFQYFPFRGIPRVLKTDYMLNFSNIATTRSILDLQLSLDGVHQDLKLYLRWKTPRDDF